MIHAFIKKGCFQDSVSLMIISRKLSESENVDDVSVMMGTPANKALLDTTGFWHDDFNNATPNDICVAIRSEAADAGIAVVSSLPEATLLAAALIHPLSPATQQHTPSLLENVAVINIGLRSFALALQSASQPVVHYQWSPVAGGNKKLARLLERLQ